MGTSSSGLVRFCISRPNKPASDCSVDGKNSNSDEELHSEVVSFSVFKKILQTASESILFSTSRS